MTGKTVRLAQVVNVKGGKRLPAGASFSSEKTSHPYIRGQDIRDGRIRANDQYYISEEVFHKISRYTVDEGDVCVTIVGNIGDVGIIPPDLAGANLTENAVKLLPAVPVLDRRFLAYALLSPDAQQQMKLSAAGAAQPKLGIYKINEIQIPFPCFHVQKRIASILSAYDDLIENNTRRIAILEEMARRIYEEWFVRFRFPGHEDVEMVESELGFVPSAWLAMEVKNLVRRLPSGVVYRDSEVQMTGDVPVVDQSTSEFLGFHNDEPGHMATVNAPIVIFGDHTCKMQLMVTPFSVGPNTVPFVTSGLPPHYVYALVRGLVSTHDYKRHWSDLIKKRVIVADEMLALKYSQTVAPMAAMIEKMRCANRNLRTTRDLLLPKLISGEIDVSAIPAPESIAA